MNTGIIFIKKKKVLKKPKNFSYFCYNFLKNYQGTLFDAGCGNGRDTVFFNKKKIKTIGLDTSISAIKNNKKKYQNLQVNFKKKNFCDYFNVKLKENFSIYLRFTIHTINLNEEKLFFKNILRQKKLEYLFVETRTIDDELYGIGEKIGNNEFFSDHYRRFIVPNEFKKNFKKNFKIIYFKTSKKFAKFRNFKPNVLRIIAKRVF